MYTIARSLKIPLRNHPPRYSMERRRTQQHPNPNSTRTRKRIILPSRFPDWRKKKPGLLFTSHPSVFHAATHLPARFDICRDKHCLTATGTRVGIIHEQSWHATSCLELEWLGSRWTKEYTQYLLLNWKRVYKDMLMLEKNASSESGSRNSCHASLGACPRTTPLLPVFQSIALEAFST